MLILNVGLADKLTTTEAFLIGSDFGYLDTYRSLRSGSSDLLSLARHGFVLDDPDSSLTKILMRALYIGLSTGDLFPVIISGSS